MKFFATAAALVGAASAMQYSNVTYTTEVVTAYTTYCPVAGSYTLPNGKVSTVTEATTLTVTDCPCTITKPASKSMPKPSMTAAPTAPAPVVAPAPAPQNYTTTVLTTDYFTTYCPQPTTVVQKNITYTVSSATTLTITNCPCTLTSTVPVTTTTIYTDKFMTYCPQPTTTVFGSQTFTITKPTTITVSNCPTTMVSVVPVMPTSSAKPSTMMSTSAKPSYVSNPFVPGAVNGSSSSTNKTASASSTGYIPAQQTTNAGARFGASAAVAGLGALAFFL